MRIKHTITPHAAVVTLEGTFLGSVSGDEFRSLVGSLLDEGHQHLVIDLAKTDLMDSTAIGILIGTLTTVRRAGGDMRLANLTKRVRNLFLMTRLLGPVFDDYPSREAAIDSFATTPAKSMPA